MYVLTLLTVFNLSIYHLFQIDYGPIEVMILPGGDGVDGLQQRTPDVDHELVVEHAELQVAVVAQLTHEHRQTQVILYII